MRTTTSRIRWVFSGPFGGKTTLAALLAELGIDFAESDTVRRDLPGFREELWTAWRQDHPAHKEWVMLDRQRVALLRKALNNGAVVISHGSPERDMGKGTDIRPYEALLIRPSSETLELRARQYLESGGKPSRLTAAIHYWSNLPVRTWKGLEATSAEEVAAMLATIRS